MEAADPSKITENYLNFYKMHYLAYSSLMTAVTLEGSTLYLLSSVESKLSILDLSNRCH
jgi:hypothetical protein